MAWLALVIVVVYYFTPVLGEATRVIEQDLVASVQLPLISVALPIPGTGPLHLFYVCLGNWLFLWLLLYFSDRFFGGRALSGRKPYRDFLSIIKLWDDLVVAIRPYLSGKLAVWLAKLILIGMALKLVVGYVLQLAMDTFMPSLLNTLLLQFGGSFSSLQGALERSIRDLIGFGVDSNGMTLLILSILILIANYAFGFEQKYRYQYAIQQGQDEIRKMQKDIKIPATQL